MPRLRTRKELMFRARQELANLALFARPPRLPDSVDQPPPLNLPRLPQHDSQPIADRLMQHRVPLLGMEIETGPEIDWRRDYVHGISTGLKYFRRIPYLDFNRAGDHKIVWELNRHQHLVVLAEAHQTDEIVAQLQSWFAANPFLQGINWTSALEVAFRVLSWTWVYSLAGPSMPEPFRRQFLNGIYQHGCYLQHNLSVYFSPNTHLLGEAVALHALGVLFPAFPKAGHWRAVGGQVVQETMERQVRDDGSHFEQSSYYHVYALDFFRLHQALGGELPEQKLTRMAEYLAAVMGPRRSLPFLGDDDGGRLFHPYGDRSKFGRDTLGTASWPHASRLFPDAGLAVLVEDDLQIIADFGSFGEGSGGHSHSDTLSIVAFLGDEEILIDPGTYTYIAEPAMRDWFRGSAAHNTVRVDGMDQATPAGPFRWHDPPVCEAHSLFEGVCRYRGITHSRKLTLEDHRLTIEDRIDGPAGEHLVEQFWHPGQPLQQLSQRQFRIGSSSVLGIDSAFEIAMEEGWRSLALGQRGPSPYLRCHKRCTFPVSFRSVLNFRADG
ncbi:MAG: alginate lyase family protein [Bryobacteraceae bacterium]